jgi:hypothetical protein
MEEYSSQKQTNEEIRRTLEQSFKQLAMKLKSNEEEIVRWLILLDALCIKTTGTPLAQMLSRPANQDFYEILRRLTPGSLSRLEESLSRHSTQIEKDESLSTEESQEWSRIRGARHPELN